MSDDVAGVGTEATAPALAIGFTPIDLSTVGPLGYSGPGAE